MGPFAHTHAYMHIFIHTHNHMLRARYEAHTSVPIPSAHSQVCTHAFMYINMQSYTGLHRGQSGFVCSSNGLSSVPQKGGLHCPQSHLGSRSSCITYQMSLSPTAWAPSASPAPAMVHVSAVSSDSGAGQGTGLTWRIFPRWGSPLVLPPAQKTHRLGRSLQGLLEPLASFQAGLSHSLCKH